MILGSMRNIIIILVIALIATSCGKRKNDDAETIARQQVDSIAALQDTLPTEMELGGYPIDYDTEVIKIVYVIDRQGVDAMQETDENSQHLLHYNYGDRLEVIETGDEFYSIRDHVQRKWREGQATVQGGRREKVFVRKSALGNISDIKLIPTDLNIISFFCENGNENAEYFEKGKTLDKYLKVELINKQVFDNKMSSKVDYFVADTANVEKVDTVTTLKTARKDVVLIDRPTEDDYEIEYNYQGQYEVLNQYVVSMVGWEWWGYKFYDKTTGKEQPTDINFAEFPYVSPDKKYVICADINPYESVAGVELYRITAGNKVENIMNITYPYWIPVKNIDNEWFWDSDGCFYMKAVHARVYTGDNQDYQYIRIKILL